MEPSPPLAGRYAIERELGSGGTATVYLANDLKHGRRVAVKVLHATLAASVGSDRFLREIGIVARLAHPYILPLLDSGEADGSPYFVAPHVPGGSLRDRLARETRLGVADALRIADEIGAGLGFAHREGIVHRDVKPENILFTDGHAVLADFGVARAIVSPHGARSDAVTASGLAVGTPAYMSPEQASGESQLTGASDQYSLACVLYEMLTGEPPLRGSSARETMALHVTTVPAPLRSKRPDVPAGVDAAVANALAKNPAERFASMEEFTSSLRLPVAHGSAGAIAARRAIAVLPFVNASSDPENEYLSDGISDELIDALAKLDGLRVASRTSTFALKGKAQDVRSIGALLMVAWVLDGTVRRSGDRLRITARLSSTSDGTLLWSHRYDRQVEDVFAIEEEIARTIVDTLRATSLADLAPLPQRRRTENARAYGLYLRGRFAWNQRTNEGVVDAVRHFEEAIAEDPEFALAYTGLADAYALQIDYRSIPVAEGFARAREFARKALALDESLPEAHASLAWTLFIYDWDWEGAGREFRRAIELDPRYATAHQWYAFLQAVSGHVEDGLVEAHTALDLDPASVSIRRAVGWIYYYARRYDQAIHHAQRAIAMNPSAEESYRILGLSLTQQGRFDDAIRTMREAQALPGAGAYTDATAGYALGRAGRTAEAEAIAGDLEGRRARGGAYVSPVAIATLKLGLGEWNAALDWMERAYEERRGWLAYLKLNPLFDPLRGGARFEDLVRRMRL